VRPGGLPRILPTTRQVIGRDGVAIVGRLAGALALTVPLVDAQVATVRRRVLGHSWATPAGYATPRHRAARPPPPSRSCYTRKQASGLRLTSP